MALLKIVQIGDERLRRKCRPVSEVNDHIRQTLDDMVETMNAAEGCGLAAPQVGVLRRLVVVDTPDTGVLYMVNPVIISASGSQEEVEGCLSVPGKSGITHRPMTVTVRATGKDGKEYTITGSGLTARAFCHEIDHLDGILYVDNAVRMLEDEEES